jgi:hypothetical protein
MTKQHKEPAASMIHCHQRKVSYHSVSSSPAQLEVCASEEASAAVLTFPEDTESRPSSFDTADVMAVVTVSPESALCIEVYTPHTELTGAEISVCTRTEPSESTSSTSLESTPWSWSTFAIPS